ncbi:hypothetical protein [Paenibacillus soyae]|uniref:Uncharacterized protein n=1 Tax=Paenibacillus soyae TaxID=2969249 RepID=A0A9X2MQD4_9BACL|nr:hypothetical protein [Paenibacillus soyae]MCR2804269.1 hypothetical protein [Paenibacillus soyae]
MEINELKENLKSRYPTWNIYYEQSGECIWVSMNDSDLNYIELQVTSNEGVGITRRTDNPGIDFSGHDEKFNSLKEALEYLDRNLL